MLAAKIEHPHLVVLKLKRPPPNDIQLYIISVTDEYFVWNTKISLKITKDFR